MKMNNNKTPGASGIGNNHLKHLSRNKSFIYLLK